MNENVSRGSQERASWVFGALTLIFLGVAYYVPSSNPDAKWILIIFTSILAGFLGFFMTGTVAGDAMVNLSSLGRLTVRGGGAIFLFVIVLLVGAQFLGKSPNSPVPQKSGPTTEPEPLVPPVETPPAGPPTARVSVKQSDSGVATLQFLFANVSRDFRVQRVDLHATQVGAEVAYTTQPSDRVKPVSYDVEIPADFLQDDNPSISVDLDLYRARDEPYARADLTLWYEKPDSQVTLKLKPVFFDENGKQMTLTVAPPEVEVTLRNSRLIQAKEATGRAAVEAKGKGEGDVIQP